MTNHESYMLEAVKLSFEAIKSGEGGPFGAVIVKDGKIIAGSGNKVIKTNDPTAHAEIMAIRQASQALNTFDLSGCVIYTSCEPCPMCLAACYWANIDQIFYSNTKKDAENIGFKDNFIYEAFTRPDTKMTRVHLPESLEAFNKWDQTPDKTPY